MKVADLGAYWKQVSNENELALILWVGNIQLGDPRYKFAT